MDKERPRRLTEAEKDEMERVLVKLATGCKVDVDLRKDCRIVAEVIDPDARVDAEAIREDIKKWWDEGGSPPVLLTTGLRIKVVGPYTYKETCGDHTREFTAPTLDDLTALIQATKVSEAVRLPKGVKILVEDDSWGPEDHSRVVTGMESVPRMPLEADASEYQRMVKKVYSYGGFLHGLSVVKVLYDGRCSPDFKHLRAWRTVDNDLNRFYLKELVVRAVVRPSASLSHFYVSEDGGEHDASARAEKMTYEATGNYSEGLPEFKVALHYSTRRASHAAQEGEEQGGQEGELPRTEAREDLQADEPQVREG